MTPAVTRRRSTGVHNRISYTADQLGRLTVPPSEPEPEQLQADDGDPLAQPEDIEPPSPEEDDEEPFTAVVKSSCHQTLNERFHRHRSDDEDDDEDPQGDSRSISSNSSLGKRNPQKRGNRPDGTGSSRRALKKQRDAADQDLLRLRGGARDSES